MEAHKDIELFEVVLKIKELKERIMCDLDVESLSPEAQLHAWSAWHQLSVAENTYELADMKQKQALAHGRVG